MRLRCLAIAEIVNAVVSVCALCIAQVFLPMWVLVASFLLCSCQPVPRQFFRTWSVRVRWTARFFAFALVSGRVNFGA